MHAGRENEAFLSSDHGQRVADLFLDAIHDLRREVDQAEADRADEAVGKGAASMRHADEDEALDSRVGVENQRALDHVVWRHLGVEPVGVVLEIPVPAPRARC